jgi:hypothetical protein
MAKQTKAEKMRVALAKDVQLQLKSRAFRVETGNYCSGTAYDTVYNLGDTKPDGDVRNLVGSKLTKCTVCAKGALLIAHVLRNDKITVDEFIDFADGGLKEDNPVDSFTDKQWAEIEILFEGESIGHYDILGERNVEFLIEYNNLVLDDYDEKNRLRQIMQLIIDSAGKRVLLPHDDRF